ncbi:MAG: ethanolamine ammonia-lyase subunit EutC [Bryobacteraceae bacterium]
MITLRQFTMARVGLGRAGNSLPTSELLDFRLAHARARDAVHSPFDVQSLLVELRQLGLETIAVESDARDRTEYLRRPDRGRRLSAASSRLPRSQATSHDVAFVIADGLSPVAVLRHAVPLLSLVSAELVRDGWSIAPVVVVERGRVAIGDEIGAALGARLVVVLIGERPGLSSPDSLGIYVTWDPRPGRTDAERNCISNVRLEGLSYEAAAFKLLFLAREARRLKLTGVQLKKDDTARLLGN